MQSCNTRAMWDYSPDNKFIQCAFFSFAWLQRKDKSTIFTPNLCTLVDVVGKRRREVE